MEWALHIKLTLSSLLPLYLQSEKQRADVSRELEDLGDRLEEQGGATAAQIEVNKRREAELSKLKRELEDSIVQHESVASQLRKKHTDAVAELTENLEGVNRSKSKWVSFHWLPNFINSFVCLFYVI